MQYSSYLYTIFDTIVIKISEDDFILPLNETTGGKNCSKNILN